MKKIVFILCFIIFTAVYNVKANASQLWELENNLKEELYSGTKFSVIQGIEDVDRFLTSTFYECYKYGIYEHVRYGDIYLYGRIVGDDSITPIYWKFTVKENHIWYKAQVYLKDTLIYEVIDEEDVIQITTCKTIDLYDFIGYSKEGFSLEVDKEFTYDELTAYDFYPQHGPIDVEYYTQTMAFTCLEGFLYKKNELYEGKELHFITEVSNLLTLEEILNSLQVTDYTDGKISNIEIIDNTYVLDNDFIEPGSYTMKIKAKDSSNHITIQECFIDVYDILPPKIVAENKEVAYNATYNLQMIKNWFTVEGDEEYTLEIIENTYSPNARVLGTYKITAKATDGYGNEAYKTIEVKVIDKTKPTITIQQAIRVPIHANYEVEDMKQFVLVYDEIDQEITDYKLTDLNDFVHHSKDKGYYNFLVEAEDKSGNAISTTFRIYLSDEDFPVIEAPLYTIIVSSDQKISKEEVIQLLIRTGQISSEDVMISSLYFDEFNPSGSYLLNIEDKNGIIYTSKIEVADNAIDFTVPSISDSKNKNHLFFYILGGILGSIGIILTVLGVICYKKQH